MFLTGHTHFNSAGFAHQRSLNIAAKLLKERQKLTKLIFIDLMENIKRKPDNTLNASVKNESDKLKSKKA